MTREEIREKHLLLMDEWVKNKGYVSDSLKEKFHELKQVCPHLFGCFNYELDLWACPDCGLRK